MRTSLLVAIRHDGTSELVAGPEVSIVEQREILRGALAAGGVHDDFCRLIFIDTEPERVVKFNTPKQAQAQAAQRQRDEATHRDAVTAAAKPAAKPTAQPKAK